jgi:hypothetical protein
MGKPIRVTFLLPRSYEVALKKLRARDPAIRTRTDALLHLIRAGLQSVRRVAPRASR